MLNLKIEIMRKGMFLLSAVFSLLIISCNDSSVEPSINDDLVLKSAEISENDMMAESVLGEVGYEVAFFAESERLLRQLAKIKGNKNLVHGKVGMRYKAGNNPNVSINQGEQEYPITITIDYGESTTLKNGRLLSGIVTIEVSAPRGTDGACRTITYSDCVIDSVQIEGVVSELFTGDNENSRALKISSNVTLTLPDGTVLDYSGNRVREWLEGIETPMEHADDRIQITGTVAIESSTGEVWSKNIIEPLIKVSDCRHPVQGVVQFFQNDAIMATLNYGNGECDNLATLTINGEEVEIELQGLKPHAKVDKFRARVNNKGKGK